MNRRDFLATAGAAAVAAALPSQTQAQAAKRVPLGIQFFTFVGPGIGVPWEKYSANMEAARKMGYDGIELAGLQNWKPEQIKAKGKVSRGQLGINIQEVSQELAQSFGLPRPSGALVVRVDPQGPAGKAGLQTGDIILKLDTGDGKTYTYQTVIQDMQSTKVRFGKGLRARYFSFELISTGPDFDLDTVEFLPLVAQRRV